MTLESIKPTINDYIICFFTVLIVFVIFFYGTDYLCSIIFNNFHSFYFNWETKIPFLPIAYLIYFGILFLPYTIYHFVKNRIDLYKISLKLIIAIVIGCLIFIVYPTKFAFQKSESKEFIEHLVVTIGAKHNLFPSLHVALSLIIILGIWPYLKLYLKILFTMIIILLILSTLLTYQHHFIDILGGLLLAACVNLLNLNILSKWLVNLGKKNY